jgi:predicted nucleic acid-binding protein
MIPIAILDACVLFPASLRDFYVWLAISGAFRAHWSDLIHEEWIRNLLLSRPDLNKTNLERCRQLMNLNVQESLVTGFEELITTLTLPDENDRHVLAAAIHCKANYIVTFNLKDFPRECLINHRVEAIHPDDFAKGLFSTKPELVCEATRQQRALLKNPPKSVDEFLQRLEGVGLTQTVSLLRSFSHVI